MNAQASFLNKIKPSGTHIDALQMIASEECIMVDAVGFFPAKGVITKRVILVRCNAREQRRRYLHLTIDKQEQHNRNSRTKPLVSVYRPDMYESMMLPTGIIIAAVFSHHSFHLLLS